MILYGYSSIPAGSPVSSIVMNAGIDTYSFMFYLYIDNVVCPASSSTSYLLVQLSTDGGTTYKTTNYVNANIPSITAGLNLGILYDSGTSNAYTIDAQTILTNMPTGTGYISVTGTSNSFANGGSGPVMSAQVPSGRYNGGVIIANAFRIISSDGNPIAGNFYFYAG